ncbi:MAG: polysaccharide deacetylase family protein [Clostridia bacterium]|nr:polysaccharide deacetylase family protein [Clostridia bacterium]
MKHNLHMRFPEGRAKALTFSYDDNVKQNARLVEILDRHGMKGTFNLNSGVFKNEIKPGSNTMPVDEITALFADGRHEVAVHGLTHPFLEALPPAICTHEVLQDRLNLEQRFGRIVRGMAYPMGTYSDEAVDCLKACGILYARTTEYTEKFNIPTDWLRLPATCHHNNPRLMELAECFAAPAPKHDPRPKLFYLWGHTYEFDNNDNWNVIEEFTDFMAGREQEIWYATNGEIFEYMEDYKRLIFAADGAMVKNPTARTLWFYLNGEVYSVAPGGILLLK